MTLFLNKKKSFSKHYQTIIKTGGAILRYGRVNNLKSNTGYKLLSFDNISFSN